MQRRLLQPHAKLSLLQGKCNLLLRKFVSLISFARLPGRVESEI